MVNETLSSSGMSSKAPLENRQWFVFRESSYFGPYRAEEIKTFLDQGAILETHSLWRPGMSDWVPVKNFDIFSAYLPNSLQKAQLSDQDFADLEARLVIKDSGAQDLFGPSNFNPTYSGAINSLFDSELPGFKESEGASSDKAKDSETSEPLPANKQTGRRIFLGAGLGIVSLGLAALIFFIQTDPEPLSLIDQADIRKRLASVTRTSPGQVPIVDSHILQSVSGGEPQVILATNLPIGSQLEISVKGVPGTLVGAPRATKEFTHVVEQPFFLWGPIRRQDGRSMPMGDYQIKASCLNCTDIESEKNLSLPRTYFLGGQKNSQYFDQLNRYLSTLSIQSELEINELTEIFSALKDQDRQLAELFGSSIGKSRSARALLEKSIKTWQVRQEEILVLFEQLGDLQFRESIVFIEAYLSLRDYGAQLNRIFDRHKMTLKNSSQSVDGDKSLSDLNFEKRKAEVQFADHLREAREKLGSQKTSKGGRVKS
jgi:hypothetical protein